MTPAVVAPRVSGPWRDTVRIISSRFPPIAVYERVADPDDLEAVFAIEALTNPRLRDEAGELQLVPPADRVSGPGAGWIMAPFTHLAPGGGRFSTRWFGAWYAALTRTTAIRETVHHRTRFLSATREPPQTLDMRVLVATIAATCDDLRGGDAAFAPLLDPDDYGASQAWATRRRAEGSDGVVWPSVRDAEGSCVATWRPRCVSPPRQASHLAYVWDGGRITGWYERSRFHGL